MRHVISAAIAAILVSALGSVYAAPADDAKPVIDKAVQALGGAEKLGGLKAAAWSAKGKMRFRENESEFTSKLTAQGVDHYRQEFEGDFGGNPVKFITVIAGDKGWSVFGDQTRELDGDRLANQKRTTYLQAVAATVLPLTTSGFKIVSVSEEKVGDKPAAVIKATGPDGKDFQLFFDKESGLPVKQTAEVAGFGGEEYTQETTFSNYKDFGGIKRATKIESKRDGESFMTQEITDFKALDKVDAGTFQEP